MRINEAIRDCVIFLGVKIGDQFVPYGTGFLVVYNLGIGDDLSVVYLISAKHVVEDISKSKYVPSVRLNNRAGGVTVGNLGGEWHFHPTDATCDIAVTGLLASKELYDFKGIEFPKGFLTQAYIEQNDIGAGDEVFTSGLLVSHFGEERNAAIVRTGNIAAMPGEKVQLGGFLGKQEVYLIESRSIGGLSGSPVFLHTPPIRLVKSAAKDMGGHLSEYFLGVNIGLFEAHAHGDALPQDIANKRERFLETMSAGIAVVVPAQRVIEILESDAVKSNRDQVIANYKRDNT